MQEWPIKDVARATGLTSRTLRHYEKIGLLLPSRLAHNGYRFYGEAELARLYRILSLRELELPLAAIRDALDDDTTLAEAIRSHLALLTERQARTARQIGVVQQALGAITKGHTMKIDNVFAGVDPAQYEGEVRKRWGDEAWEKSAARRTAMSTPERHADDKRSADVTTTLATVAASGLEPESSEFQALITEHYQWVTDHWSGRKPNVAAYTGLAEMYVADERFAAAYGGLANAKVIRDAMLVWITGNLTD